jgi:muramidase (phage lysozyme)
MNAEANTAAFLDMIDACEGVAPGADAYRTLFGWSPRNPGALFSDFSDHPNVKTPFRQTDGTMNYSTAAGRYQIIHPTFVRLQAKLGTTGFGPDVQDAMARELIAEAGAMMAVKAGDLQTAIDKCSGIWASLPSSNYAQPKRSIQFARIAFSEAGGTIA